MGNAPECIGYGFFVSGATMRKPYSSKSNYILKMSDYKKGEWSEIWDETYDKFVLKHKEKTMEI